MPFWAAGAVCVVGADIFAVARRAGLLIGPELPWSAHARPRRGEKTQRTRWCYCYELVKDVLASHARLGSCLWLVFCPRQDFMLISDFVEGRANTQLRTSADAYNRREVRPRFPGFGRPATHTLALQKAAATAQNAGACGVHERIDIAFITQINSSQRPEKPHRSGPPHTHATLTQARRAPSS